MRQGIGIFNGTLANLRLKWKLWLIIFILSLISCIVIFVYAMLVFENYDEVLYRNTSQLLYMSMEKIEDDLLRIEESSGKIVTDPLVQSALRKQTNNAVIDAEPNARKREPTLAYNIAAGNLFNAMWAQWNDNPHIVSVSAYFEDQHIYAGSERKSRMDDEVEQALAAAHEANGRPVWLSGGSDDYSVLVVREIKGIRPFTLEPLGVLVIRVDLAGIVSKHLRERPDFAFSPQLFVASAERVVYRDLQTALDVTTWRGSGYRILRSDSGRDFLTYTDQSRLGWRYAMVTPFDKVVGSLERLKWSALVIGVLMIVVSMILAGRWSSQIARHLDTLVQKMKTFKAGHFEPDQDREYAQRKDEMGVIHQSFQEMTEELRRLVADNYVKQLLLKEASIKALQNQLDPHFLFNVLQSINWEAKASSEARISAMLEALGRLLRYTVDEEAEMVPLARELEVVRSYVEIQKYRYPDRLVLIIDVPAALSDLQVPRLAVQNLVENAIKHGLEHVTGLCQIQIYAEERADAYYLCVEDNGPGIDPHMLEKLDRKEVLPMGLGIGLRNIQQRIHLLFPSGSDLLLHNTGSGTIAEIRLIKEKGALADV